MNTQNVFSMLSESINTKLNNLGITEPTAVQTQLIPQILDGKNVLFQSETGTGKTFAYLLPIIQKIEAKENDTKVKAIVVAPTFELASQINMACKTITDRKSALLIGGAPIKRQTEVLKEKPEIIIGTTARLIELIRLKKLKTDGLVYVVYDETDRLVKKETIDDTKEFQSLLPKNVQKIACTATINKATKSFFNESENYILPPEDVLKKRITHIALYAEQRDKIELLRKLILAENPSKALIFTSRSDQVENIFNKLSFKKIECAALHAKADKVSRKANLDRFRSGKLKVLITSDLAARGLDIPDISHVIQMDLPSDEDFFVHRSGRTARAGKTGTNIVIGDEYELNHLAALEKKLGIIIYPKQVYAGKLQNPIMDDEE